MELTKQQKELVILTMELDLKAREYKALCNELEKLKKLNLDPNAQEYKELKLKFLKNSDEIEEINIKLKNLQNKG